MSKIQKYIKTRYDNGGISINYGNDPIIKDIDPNKKLRSSDLLTDSEWIKASKQLYKNSTGKDFIGTDEAVALTPKITLDLEQALEFIDDDELVEVTPSNIRIRKRLIT